MLPHPRPLIEVLVEIPDFRKYRSKRHTLAAILALAGSAMLCGARSYTAIAAWERNDGVRLAHALGLTRQSPCAATLHGLIHQRARWQAIPVGCARVR